MQQTIIHLNAYLKENEEEHIYIIKKQIFIPQRQYVETLEIIMSLEEDGKFFI